MGAHYPQMLKYIYVGVSVCRCSRHILVSSALLHSLCPVSTFSPAFLLLLSLLLEDLLCAGGRDVQESPGCVWVQLFLVTTQRPNIHHSHHLPLLRWREEVSPEETVWRGWTTLKFNFQNESGEQQYSLNLFLIWPGMSM